MKKVLISLFIISIFSRCGTKDVSDNCLFPLIENNISSSLKVVDIKCFGLNSDFLYPRHSYFIISGENENILAFIRKIGLSSKTDSLIQYNKQKLCEYSGEFLWNTEGYQDTKEDSLIRLNYKMEKNAEYAGYFNSDVSNTITLNSKAIWNGKIVACIKNDTCLLFVEELKSPKFRRE